MKYYHNICKIESIAYSIVKYANNKAMTHHLSIPRSDTERKNLIKWLKNENE